MIRYSTDRGVALGLEDRVEKGRLVALKDKDQESNLKKKRRQSRDDNKSSESALETTSQSLREDLSGRDLLTNQVSIDIHKCESVSIPKSIEYIQDAKVFSDSNNKSMLKYQGELLRGEIGEAMVKIRKPKMFRDFAHLNQKDENETSERVVAISMNSAIPSLSGYSNTVRGFNSAFHVVESVRRDAESKQILWISIILLVLAVITLGYVFSKDLFELFSSGRNKMPCLSQEAQRRLKERECLTVTCNQIHDEYLFEDETVNDN